MIKILCLGFLLSILCLATVHAQTIGYAGCSNTKGAITGYHNLTTANLFWPDEFRIGGGTVKKWADPDGPYWSDFDQMVATHGADEIWFQLCETRDKRRITSYGDVLDALQNIRDHAPGVQIYLSPLNSYKPKDLCPRVAGPVIKHLIRLTDRAVLDGYALRGPDLGPLTPQTVSLDNCHPNDAGRDKLGLQLVAFFD